MKQKTAGLFPGLSRCPCWISKFKNLKTNFNSLHFEMQLHLLTWSGGLSATAAMECQNLLGSGLSQVKSYIIPKCRDSLLVTAPGSWSKGCEFESGTSGGRIFFSGVNFVCWLLFGVRSTPVLPQWHVKDPGHSAKSVGGRLHLNTHLPLTQQSWSGLTMPLSRHSVWTYQETSSHATRQGILGHSHLSSLSHCGLILAYRVELVCTS